MKAGSWTMCGTRVTGEVTCDVDADVALKSRMKSLIAHFAAAQQTQ